MCIKTNRKGLTITNNEDFIFLTAKSTVDSRGNLLQFITDYTPELFELIADSRICWTFDTYDRQKKRPYLRAAIKDGENTIRIHIGRLVIGYFLFGLNSQNLIEKIKEINLYFNENGLEAEHLYSDEKNCIRANLSVTTKHHNRYKTQAIDGKYSYACFPVMVHTGGEYRAIVYQTGGFVYSAFDIKAHSLIELTDKLQEIVKRIKPVQERLQREQRRVCTNYWILQKYLYERFGDNAVADDIGQLIATGNFCMIKKSNVEKGNKGKSNSKVNI